MVYICYCLFIITPLSLTVYNTRIDLVINLITESQVCLTVYNLCQDLVINLPNRHTMFVVSSLLVVDISTAGYLTEYWYRIMTLVIYTLMDGHVVACADE